ncbi:MFS transporter [Actinoplanes sp. NPDC023801]|uniref:MFS transporter n=1 Tax=Actinoplanes sp. NPDC023801 TaxID=3154595 RepID=UPI003407A20E
MPQFSALGRIVGTGIKAGRLIVRGSVRGGAWATRRVGSARARGAANEVGMIRLFDLHAVSCAGDALIAIGLAGTIFSVPLGEARSKVALYLLITMVPFALLAPVVGPLLDHFRHGRRYALAATFLGRAFLAYVMSVELFGWGLYPAAFGVLALSRAYGVARSAAVPRLLPEGIGLSQVGARASVYGTFAGILVAPIGLLAFKFGPQWPLRVATIIFLVGMVVALRLPPRADSDPPEALPRAWRGVLGIGRGSERPLSNRLVVATLIGSSSLRLLYGFLLLFLTFAIMGNQLTTEVFGMELGRNTAAGVVGGALALGTFLSTAAGTGLRIRRPLALQSSGLIVVAGVAVLTTIFYNLAMVTLLALLTATFSGIAKLAVDASIQERVPERQRATAFAHSETALMLAWVAGGGLGIIPFDGRLGLGFAALLAVLAAVRAGWAAARLHNERLAGRPDAVSPDVSGERTGEAATAKTPAAGPQPATDTTDRPADTGAWVDAEDPWADKDQTVPLGGAGPPSASTWSPATVTGRGTPAQRHPAAATRDTAPRPAAHGTARDAGRPATGAHDGDTQRLDADADVTPGGRRWWRRKAKSAAPAGRSGAADRPPRNRGGLPNPGGLPNRSGLPNPGPVAESDRPGSGQTARKSPDGPRRTGRRERDDADRSGSDTGSSAAPPGYHVYRPSSAGTENGDPAQNEDS